MKNKEIEEILYVLKHIVIGRTSRLTSREADKLLSYIEQLKEEQEENYKQSEWLVKKQKKIEQLENNRDKAIEYIKMHSNALGVLDTIKNYTLLDILGDKK
jgi:sugar-specific transcriptional regulator TrmB